MQLAEALKKSGLVSSEKCDKEIAEKKKAELSREQKLKNSVIDKGKNKEDDGEAA